MDAIRLFLSEIVFAQSANPILYQKIFRFAEYGLILFLLLSLVTSIRRGDFLIFVSSVVGLISGFAIIYYAEKIFAILVSIFKFIYGVIAWIIKYLIWSWLQYVVMAIAWVWNVLIWSWLQYVDMAIKWLFKVLIWSWLKYVFIAIGWILETLIWSWLKYVFVALLWVWNNLIWVWLKYLLIGGIALAATIYFSACIFLDLLQTRAGRRGSFLSSFIIGIFAALVFLLNHSLLLYLFITGCLIGSFGYLQAIFSKRRFSFIFHSIGIMKQALEGSLEAAMETAGE